eukprot:554472-Prymnesium_polylepis.1
MDEPLPLSAVRTRPVHTPHIEQNPPHAVCRERRLTFCEYGYPGPTEARGGSLVESTAQCRTKRA